MQTNHWIIRPALFATACMSLGTAGCETGSSPNSGTVHSADSNVKASSQPSAHRGSDRDHSHADGDHSHADGEHTHTGGQHGGTIVSLGRDSYHVEAVVDADGRIRLFTLGNDETRVIDVESQTLKGYVKADGESEAQEMLFEPSPQEGDAANRTSLFVGKLPTALIGRDLDVTIPNIRIDGERFRLAFRSAREQHSADSDMPQKVSSDEEKELYLTPGGRYTASDIEANGKVTASQKFKGLKSEHNMNPQAGEIICPISGTKASPKFPWTIGGKVYQFCCPPCVDEFLANAKKTDEPLPEPDHFTKK